MTDQSATGGTESGSQSGSPPEPVPHSRSHSNPVPQPHPVPMSRVVPVPEPIVAPESTADAVTPTGSDAPQRSGLSPSRAPTAAGPAVIDIAGIGRVPLASMVERIMGAVIDAVLLVIPTMIAVVVLPDGLEFAAGTAVSAAYIIPLLATRGATVGGRLMGIRCVAADGRAPGFQRSAKRWLLLMGPGLIPVVGWLATLIVGLSPMVDANRRMQGFHDIFAGTYVVATGPGSPIAP